MSIERSEPATAVQVVDDVGIVPLPAEFTVAIEAFRVHLVSELGRSPHTVRAYLGDVTRLLRHTREHGATSLTDLDLTDLRGWLAQEGMGVLLIEHNVRFVTQLCHHIYVLDSGRMIASGTPTEVINDPAVITAYLGA